MEGGERWLDCALTGAAAGTRVTGPRARPDSKGNR